MQTQLKSKWACGIIMVLALVMSIINLSCEKTKESGTQAQEGSQNSALPIPGDQTQTTASTATPVPVANPTKDSPLMTPESVIAPGMNPPHGQPGHRCDIAVGAPLDSPPGTGKTPPIASQQNVPTQTTTPTTAPGMNPPHGQPGHRCDIAVGAPLDSPPGTGKTPPATGGK
jgi:hypothetical protein